MEENTMEKFRAKHDVQIPNDLLSMMYQTREKLTKGEVCVLLDIIQRGGRNHETPLSRPQLCLDTALSESTIKRAVNSLRERGLIQSEHTQGSCTPALYTMPNRCKKHFTQIPRAAFNALTDAVTADRLTLSALRLLLFIWRNTYGFHTKERHFSDKFIREGTGITQSHAHNALKELQRMDFIVLTTANYYYHDYPCEVKFVILKSTPLPNLTRDPLPNLNRDPLPNLNRDENEPKEEEKPQSADNTEENEINRTIFSRVKFGREEIYINTTVKDIQINTDKNEFCPHALEKTQNQIFVFDDNGSDSTHTEETTTNAESKSLSMQDSIKNLLAEETAEEREARQRLFSMMTFNSLNPAEQLRRLSDKD